MHKWGFDLNLPPTSGGIGEFRPQIRLVIDICQKKTDPYLLHFCLRKIPHFLLLEANKYYKIRLIVVN